MSEDPNFQASRNAQEKFDHYLPILTFTLVGLSIQTAKWDYLPSYRFEIIGWALLFISGVLSLLRLERKSVFYAKAGTANDLKKQADESRNDQVIAWEMKISADLKRDSRRMVIMYGVQRWALILGFLAIIIARALTGYQAVVVSVQ